MLENLTADGLWPYVHEARRFSDLCRKLNDMGVLGLPAKVKWPIAREICDRLGFAPTPGSFRSQLSPSAHVATRDQSKREATARFYSKPGNSEKNRRSMAGYRATAKGKDYRRGYIKERRATDPEYVAADRLRNRLNGAIRNHRRATGRDTQKRAKTLALVGCTVSEFLAHIEGQFEPGMTLDNVHLDHIRPLASFERPDDPAAWHYTNFRPSWPSDNLSKGSLWEGERHRFR